jgi:hypothetical protein
MKNHKKITDSKLLTRFDKELKTILMNDLNNNKSLKQPLLYGNQRLRLQVR